MVKLATAAALAAFLLPASAFAATSKTPTISGAIASAAIPGLGDILTKIFNQGSSALLADMASADSVAGAVDPNSPNQPPYNVYQYNAHMCITAAQPWLTSAFGTPSSVPTPTGAGGILTTLVQAEVSVSTAQEFINKLVGNGIPSAVQFNCAAWAQQLIATPATVMANAQSDFINLITLFAKH